MFLQDSSAHGSDSAIFEEKKGKKQTYEQKVEALYQILIAIGNHVERSAK